MLAKDVYIGSDPIVDMIASLNGNSTIVLPLEPGFYQIGHFSLGNLIGSQLKQEWPDIKGIPNCYGVCDTPSQFIRKYKKILSSDKRRFIVSFTIVLKKKQSESGGWRWHKWGPYVGTKKPQCEYLYDEPKIEQACCYHIYEVN
jgi:hypothetical protein